MTTQPQGFVALLSGLTLTTQTPLPEGYPENPETVGEHIRCIRLYTPDIIAFLGFDPRPEGKTLGEKVRCRAKQLGIDRKSMWTAETDQAGKKVRKVVSGFVQSQALELRSPD
jgi:hypothetical protein